MKAVITKITGNKAVLLRQDGTFVRAANRGYRVGQQIELPSRRRPVLRPAMVAACLLVVILSATALAAQTLPFSYISVDVNPSLQMTLNWYDRVRTVEAVNEDAQALAEQLTDEGIVGQPIDSAMQMIYSSLAQNDYLTADANDVVVGVASYGIKDVTPLAQQLEQIQTEEESGLALNVKTLQVDTAAIDEAKTYGTTAGKLAAVKPLVGDAPEDTQAWLDRPVRDILNASPDGNEIQMDQYPLGNGGKTMPSLNPDTSQAPSSVSQSIPSGGSDPAQWNSLAANELDAEAEPEATGELQPAVTPEGTGGPQPAETPQGEPVNPPSIPLETPPSPDEQDGGASSDSSAPPQQQPGGGEPGAHN